MSLSLDKSIKSFIRVYEYDLSAAASLVERLDGWNTHRWYNAATNERYSEKEKELEVRGVDDYPETFNHLTRCLLDAAKQYTEELITHGGITTMSKARLHRYLPGTVMRKHVDHIHDLFDGQIRGIPIISLVGALGDQYTGGDLVICGEPYRLKSGQIIVWPSCFLYPHEVTEITGGTRFSFVSWAW